MLCRPPPFVDPVLYAWDHFSITLSAFYPGSCETRPLRDTGHSCMNPRVFLPTFLFRTWDAPCSLKNHQVHGERRVDETRTPSTTAHDSGGGASAAPSEPTGMTAKGHTKKRTRVWCDDVMMACRKCAAAALGPPGRVRREARKTRGRQMWSKF